jgi:glycerophosphoryl diester phosphodiesterase
MIISHRGRKTGKRENTLESFETAFKLGASGIECDLRITKDNKVIISHDKILGSIPKDQLYLDTLLDYIKSTKKPFFLELKSASPQLVGQVADGIKREKLWDFVHLIGFSVFIKTALSFQKDYSKLKVIPFLNNPYLSYIKSPKSYGVFMGWIDDWKGSQLAFRSLIPEGRLKALKKRLDKKGIKVMAGVINNERGLKYFKNAEIENIVTDEIQLASTILD